jgi:hypothetical protein
MVAMGREGLRLALVQAAQQARDSGQLGHLAALRIRRVTQPSVWNRLDSDVNLEIGEHVEAFCTEHGNRAGVVAAGAPDAIDWNALLDFLEKILPLLLEFVKELMALFG